MRPTSFGVIFLACALGFGAAIYARQASAGKKESALEQSMGGIEWGWSPKQVYRYLAKGIEKNYQKRIAKATDAIEEDRLRHQIDEEKARIRDSFFEFNGTPSAYDAGFLKNEFTQRNGESLLRVKTKNSQDYFFFINDRLWKRYRAFDAAVFEGATFDEFGQALQKRYGKAQKKSGRKQGAEKQWLEWKERGVLARAEDNTEFYGFYCLVLEDPRTVAKLDSLRAHKSQRVANNKSMVDLVADEESGDHNADIADRISGKIRRHDRPDLDTER